MWLCQPYIKRYLCKKPITTFICNYSKNVLHQGYLQDAIKDLFPGENILINTKKDAQIRDPSTGSYMELDFWIPNKKLCFEFQDAYHYATTWYTQHPVDFVRQKDSLKKELLKEKGETLIQVPCWWDGKRESLIATIRKYRSDLLMDHQITSAPISDVPPDNFFKTHSIPGVGELMLASFPPLQFTQSVTPENPWWIGEKYDGIRCCWNSHLQKLFTRHGLNLVLPEFVTNAFTTSYLDAEIWFGRGFYHEAQQFIQSSSYPSNMDFLRIVTFDVPSPDLLQSPFEERYEKMMNIIPIQSPLVTFAVRVMCIGRKHLNKALQGIIKHGGEGVMLRKPKSIYEHGRSSCLVKLKVLRGDREALVIGITINNFVLQLPDGKVFEVGRENIREEERKRRRIHIGDVVTFSFRTYAKTYPPVGVTIERVREDLEWKHVVFGFLKDSQQLNRVSNRIVSFAPKTYGYYIHSKRKQMRNYFERLAKKWNFDPLVPSGWYSISLTRIKQLKGMKSIMNYFGGSAIKALVYLFPDIGLDSSKFTTFPRKFWDDIENRRLLFTRFARENDFDPWQTDKWLSLIPNSNEKRIQMIVRYYYHSNIAKCITHLFPEIGLDKFQLKPPPQIPREPVRARVKFYTKENCRQFLDLFAHKHNFNPELPHNWYSITSSLIVEDSKRGKAMMHQFKGSVVKLIMHAYPDIDIKINEFSARPRYFWADKQNRKGMFDEVAKANGLDPLVAADWYTLVKEKRHMKVLLPIITRFYNGNIGTALVQMYPSIGIDLQKLR